MVLFTAPGYEQIPKEWIGLITQFKSGGNNIESIALYGAKLQKLETVFLPQPKTCPIIFGLWPWQYTKSRQTEFLGQFQPVLLGVKKEPFYLAETRIRLTQASTKKEVSLRGVILKKEQDLKQELTIMTNISENKADSEAIANAYLECWPGTQKAFKDFSRKIELFTYSAASRQIFSTEDLVGPKQTDNIGIKETLAVYLKALDAYARWYFLPDEYKKLDFSTTKKRFYNLKAKIKKKKDAYLLRFLIPEDYPFLKDLNFCMLELNRHNVILPDGKRLFSQIINQPGNRA